MLPALGFRLFCRWWIPCCVLLYSACCRTAITVLLWGGLPATVGCFYHRFTVLIALPCCCSALPFYCSSTWFCRTLPFLTLQHNLPPYLQLPRYFTAGPATLPVRYATAPPHLVHSYVAFCFAFPLVRFVLLPYPPHPPYDFCHLPVLPIRLILGDYSTTYRPFQDFHFDLVTLIACCTAPFPICHKTYHTYPHFSPILPPYLFHYYLYLLPTTTVNLYAVYLITFPLMWTAVFIDP